VPSASLGATASSVVGDRLLGFGTLSTGAAAFALAFGNVASGNVRFVWIAPLALLGGVALLRFGPWLDRMGTGLLAPIADAVRPYARAKPKALLHAAGLSLFSSMTQLTVTAALVWVLGAWPAEGVGWVWAGTLSAFIAAALPGVPGGWGTTEAAYVYFFGKAGIAPSIAVSVSLLWKGFAYLWVAAGAASAVLRGRSKAVP
jgi:uncharacterized membrane protein YbhN (UPF0104 family)